jgi:hypothetical protein
MNINKVIKFFKEKLNEIQLNLKEGKKRWIIENIRLIKDSLEKVKGEALRASPKMDRDIFIYSEPKNPIDNYAQCGSCGHFNDGKCAIVKGKVNEDDSCNLYVQKDKNGGFVLYNKDEVGFHDGEVRCENCSYMKEGVCTLYEKLNFMMPELIQLNTKVDKKGCCTSFTEK